MKVFKTAKKFNKHIWYAGGNIVYIYRWRQIRIALYVINNHV